MSEYLAAYRTAKLEYLAQRELEAEKNKTYFIPAMCLPCVKTDYEEVDNMAEFSLQHDWGKT